MTEGVVLRVVTRLPWEMLNDAHATVHHIGSAIKLKRYGSTPRSSDSNGDIEGDKEARGGFPGV